MEVHVGVEWWLTVLGVGVSERRAKVDRVTPQQSDERPGINKRRQPRRCYNVK